MNHEQQEVAALIRSWAYFKEARSWYQVLYIGPIAERSFFLVIAVLAALVAVVGFTALVAFMPLTTRPALMLKTAEPERVVPVISRIRQAGQPLDRALERFMLREYIERRESYDAQQYTANFAFIRAQSDPSVFAAYDALYGAQNPRSPVAILGASGKRHARVESIAMVGDGQAVAKFSTELEGVGTQAKTQWTATLGYIYSPMQTTEVTDPKTGEVGLSVEHPQFRVVSYAISQTP
jgi:type IV secretory pathway component VirB8